MNARGVTSVMAIALAGLTFAQLDDAALKVKVTIDCPAATARKVVEDLGKAAKVKLATTLTKETLFLRIADTPLHEVMARIATATNAKWQLTGGVYRLSRSPKAEKEEADAEYKQVFDATKKALDKLVAERSPKPPSAQMSVGWSVVRTLPKLLKRIELKTLVDMQENERIVFSTQPNRMQRPMGLTLDDYAQMIADDFNYYRTDGGSGYKPEYFLRTIEQIPSGEEEAGDRPIKVTLAVWRSNNSFYFSLRHYNSRGIVVLPNFSATSWANQTPLENHPPLEGPDGKLEISEEGAAFGKWFLKGGREAPISKSLHDKLLRPDVFDPYSLQVSACLFASAKLKGVNLVANIPDSLDPVFEIYQFELPETVNGYLQSLRSKPSIIFSAEKGWITIKPSAPHAERSWYVDRVSMARLAQSCQGGQAKLWDLGDYAVANPLGKFAAVDNAYQLFFCPNIFSMGERTLDLDMLHFYGSLSGSDRKQFENGMTIRYSSLNPHLRQLATQMVYWGQPRIELDRANEIMLGNSPAQNWQSDPTELMPDGLHREGSLRVSIQNGYALSYRPDSTATQYGSMSPSHFGFDAWREEDRGKSWRDTKLLLGSRKTFNCDFLLAPGARVSKILTEDTFAPNGALKSWEELPEDLRKIVEDSIAATRERIDKIRNPSKNVPPQSYF